MAKKEVGSQDALDEMDLVDIDEAMSTPGRPSHDVKVLTRELVNMIQSLRFTKIDELAIGSYFVPYEGQLGVEGIIRGSADLMNNYVRAGWQPWNMATPYPGRFAFNLPEGQTGALDGQWITIIWAKPSEEL